MRLIDEIEARAREKKYFEEVELYSILQSCISAIQFECRYANISSHVVFITPDGVLKLTHIDLLDNNLRNTFNSEYYYSP